MQNRCQLLEIVENKSFTGYQEKIFKDIRHVFMTLKMIRL